MNTSLMQFQPYLISIRGVLGSDLKVFKVRLIKIELETLLNIRKFIDFEVIFKVFAYQFCVDIKD